MSLGRTALLAAVVPLALAVLQGCSGEASVVGGATVAVDVNPKHAWVAPSSATTFAVTVTGVADTSVSWAVQEASGGSIDASGRYTAPAGTGTFHVVATSVADPSVSGSAAVTVASLPSTGLVPAERRTFWEPGVPGGIPARTTVCTTVTPEYASANGLAAFGTDGSGNAQPAIQRAINNCPAGQVVSLPAGVYRMTTGITLASNVTLRGAGPDRTQLRLYGTGWVVGMMPGWPTWTAPKAISTNLEKDATSATLSDVAGLAVGDIVVIDQTDDPSYVFEGNCPYFKRTSQDQTSRSYGPATPATRSVGQIVEITGVSGTTVSFSPALHLARTAAHAPQLWELPRIMRNAGVEELYVTGGTSVGNIYMQDCAYCWVRHVESDGTVSANPAPNGTLGLGNGMVGAHLLMQRVFRSTVRDSYFHHATRVVQGGGAYGISFSNYSSDNLIENNIVYYMNKPLTMRSSGGGNVIAYNYVDDAWTSADTGLQETALDMGHASFPYMELVEGNYAPQIATENVWGNSGWMTIFRNYASGRQQRTDAFETYQIAAISMEVRAMYMNVVGNVLGTPDPIGRNGGAMAYEVTSNPPGQGKPAVFRLGHGVAAGSGYDDIGHYENTATAGSTYGMLLRVGNWDNVRSLLDTPPAEPLPDSLYLVGKPAFFGANTWPWVDATGATKVHVLPAKQRFDAGAPNAVLP